jgi:hypothetical protein
LINHTPQASTKTHSKGGKSLICGLLSAQTIIAKLGARRAAGETLDKMTSLHDRMETFA